MTRPLINPQMKVGELLDHFPELEEVLIGISPAFSKLRNPVLRRTIARVATLQQAAMTGDVPIHEVVVQLRAAAGQNTEIAEDMLTSTDDGHRAGVAIPAWLAAAQSRQLFDATPILDAGAHPLKDVFARLGELPEGGVLDLRTPFLPAPLIDAVEKQGWSTHVSNTSDGGFITSIGRQR
ncbi:MAG TPA: DUF1858 domain-containing protein [Bacteroidota bacterium]|nr:DUF1858 domain-containing protein [Bacteroidota bacterium]